MPIKRLEDIEREKAQEKREKFKRQITEDARDVIEGVLGGGPKKPTNKILDIVWFITKIILLLIVLMIITNLVLGNIWLLKFFWKEFFIGG
ncbi:MAG: hypothetical protein RL557_756 [archaeon]|jgi:hypothetical protein